MEKLFGFPLKLLLLTFFSIVLAATASSTPLAPQLEGQQTAPADPPVVSGDLLNLPLVQQTDQIFTYQGTFQLPDTIRFEDGVGGGGLGISEDGSSLYITSWYGSLAKIAIPSIGGSASLIFGWRSTPDSLEGDGSVQGAQLEYRGSLYRTKYSEYLGSGNATRKFIQKGTTSGTGFSNLYNLSGIDQSRRMTQALMHIPTEWQALLGGPVAALGGRLSIISAAQNGYGFATFDPSTVGSGDVRITPLLDYPYDRALEPVDSSHPAWSGYPKNSLGGTDLVSSANAPIAGALIVPGSRSLLFVTAHGYGRSDNGCRPGSSVHNDPNRVQIVAYDLRDLVRVKQGQLQPHQPRPYAWWEWNSGGKHWNSCVGNFPVLSGWGAYDATRKRWYMSSDIYGGKMHVWQVNSR